MRRQGMTKLENQLKAYYSEIKKLIASPKEQKKIVADLKGNIEVFLEENPNATYKDITDKYGRPEEIAEYYIAASEPDELRKKGNSLLYGIICLVVAAVLIAAAMIIFNLNKQKPQNDGVSANTDTSGVASTVSAPESEATSETGDESQPDEFAIEETDTSYYILAESYKRKLTEEDIAGLDKHELMLARNEIYARHGRKFVDSEVQEYFNAQGWYKGSIEPEDFDEGVELNDIEYRNIQFIQRHEN